MVSRLVRYDKRKTYRDGGREQETLADFGLVTKQSHHRGPFTSFHGAWMISADEDHAIQTKAPEQLLNSLGVR